ncbi:MAG: sodium-dependent transporter [Clostridia bacterium]|nr:sodium-dependent transporter [Clostridia bacterium]
MAKKQTALSGEREGFGSRLGFILISAGCAIGLGNVWRFPYIVGQYGGAAFILMYLLFLVIFGLPIMTMEFAVGRASRKSIISSFKTLEPKGTKWHAFGYVGAVGNYILMMFYVAVTGWMFIYFFKSIGGSFVGVDKSAVSSQIDAVKGNLPVQVCTAFLVVALGIFVCSLGLKKGVERVNKVMMILLLVIIVCLAVYVVTLKGAGAGLKYYLVPDFKKLFSDNFGEAVFAAMGQAFFTLSIGMGSMAIFGSYIKKDKRLFGEATTIAVLDTGVAFVAGLIVIPACFAFGVGIKDGKFNESGPDLIFKALPQVFNSMGPVMGRIVGSFFFLFMIFAAMSTVIAVFENIIAFGMDRWGWNRHKSCLINFILLLVLVLPCILGFNVWSGFTPLGAESDIMKLEDFIISSNILPLGSLVYVLFCTWDKKAWGWHKFLTEANTGKGAKFPSKLRFYCKYILPILLLLLWGQGIISTFRWFK